MISLINNDLTDDVSEETFRKRILNFRSMKMKIMKIMKISKIYEKPKKIMF